MLCERASSRDLPERVTKEKRRCGVHSRRKLDGLHTRTEPKRRVRKRNQDISEAHILKSYCAVRSRQIPFVPYIESRFACRAGRISCSLARRLSCCLNSCANLPETYGTWGFNSS